MIPPKIVPCGFVSRGRSVMRMAGSRYESMFVRELSCEDGRARLALSSSPLCTPASFAFSLRPLRLNKSFLTAKDAGVLAKDAKEFITVRSRDRVQRQCKR